MKKIFAFIFIVLLLLPAVAFANAPEPLPEEQEIAVKDYEEVKRIFIWASEDGENYSILDELDINAKYGKETKDSQEMIYEFMKTPSTHSFYIEVVYNTNERVNTNIVEAEDYGSYLYNTETGILRAGTIESRHMSELSYIFAMFSIPLLLGITLLFEIIVSAFFNIDPKKYILIINCITNPAMNVLLLVLMRYFVIDYTFMLIIAEICAGVIEFFFYKRKYTEYKPKKLLIFTICANTVSLLFGWFMTAWLW